ncbi:hypothetical protein LSAT2_007401 [Lamellibrachia satsuma]|nr:hypothetical protein LSAT2_007401 [Lamellibrachia satsuma]
MREKGREREGGEGEMDGGIETEKGIEMDRDGRDREGESETERERGRQRWREGGGDSILCENDLSAPEAGQALIDSISRMTSLKKLLLQQCRIGPEGMFSLARALQQCPKAFCGNDLSAPEAGQALSESISRMTSLKKLLLQQCGIGTQGMLSVARALQQCPKVEELL